MRMDNKHSKTPLINVLRGEDEGGYLGSDNVVRYRFTSKHLYNT